MQLKNIPSGTPIILHISNGMEVREYVTKIIKVNNEECYAKCVDPFNGEHSIFTDFSSDKLTISINAYINGDTYIYRDVTVKKKKHLFKTVLSISGIDDGERENCRKSRRFFINEDCLLKFKGMEHVGKIIDVSAEGCSISSDNMDLSIGDMVSINYGDRFNCGVIHCHAKVVRKINNPENPKSKMYGCILKREYASIANYIQNILDEESRTLN